MRRKLIALVLGILGLGAGILFTAINPPLYTSQAIVQVDPGGEWDPASLAIVLSSEPVLVGAARKLGLDNNSSALHGDLQVIYVSRDFTVTAKGQYPEQAQAMASAVIGSFRHFLATHDHILKKGLPTRTLVTSIVLRPPRPGAPQRPLGSYAETAGLGLLGGALLMFLVVRPSRREVRRGYRAAFTLIFGRGRIATNILGLLDGPAAEDDHKAQRHVGRDKRPAAWHAGRA